jgi:hypothetical protein
MLENQRLYASIGYEETERGSEAGYDRVFDPTLHSADKRVLEKS